MAKRTTTDGRPARICREDCTAAKPHSDCECNCGRTCHGQGICDPELHRYDRDGFGRQPAAVR